MRNSLRLSLSILMCLLATATTAQDRSEGRCKYLVNIGQYQRAVSHCRDAADQGSASAQNQLGLMYDEGLGVAQNYTEAVRWYRVAAEQGLADAQNKLGMMYLNSLGVAQSNTEAVRWFRAAAGQGLLVAQTNLGWMYGQGLGVEQNHGEAVRLTRDAAEQGDPYGQRNLGWFYQQGWGVAQDYGEAVRWYRSAAEKGVTFAQHQLGVVYMDGLGVRRNWVEAHRWFQAAYEAGHQVTRQMDEVFTWMRERDRMRARQERCASAAIETLRCGRNVDCTNQSSVIRALRSAHAAMQSCDLPEVQVYRGVCADAIRTVSSMSSAIPLSDSMMHNQLEACNAGLWEMTRRR